MTVTISSSDAKRIAQFIDPQNDEQATLSEQECDRFVSLLRPPLALNAIHQIVLIGMTKGASAEDISMNICTQLHSLLSEVVEDEKCGLKHALLSLFKDV
jgi:hypothetical protein